MSTIFNNYVIKCDYWVNNSTNITTSSGTNMIRIADNYADDPYDEDKYYISLGFRKKENESIDNAKKRLSDLIDKVNLLCVEKTSKPKKDAMNVSEVLGILTELNYNCFLTGSIEFGLDTRDSDIDICVLKSEVDFIKIKENMVLNYGAFVDTKSSYNDGVKLNFINNKFKVINFIPLSMHDWVYWHMTTTIIKDMAVFNTTLANKTMRVAMFETVSGLVRMVIGNDVNESTIIKYFNTLNKNKNKEINDILYNKSRGIDIFNKLVYFKNQTIKGDES